MNEYERTKKIDLRDVSIYEIDLEPRVMPWAEECRREGLEILVREGDRWADFFVTFRMRPLRASDV